MRRNATSGINTKDAEIILKFLLYYTQRIIAEDEGTQFPPPAPNIDEPSPPPPVERSAAPAPANPAVLEGPMTEPAREPIDGGTP